MTTRNIRLLLEYDGAPFLGWQVQRGGPTVQAAIEGALLRLTGERLRVTGSGRTDAGVHALGQVANFHTGSRMEPRAFQGALTSLLRPSIAVIEAEEVPLDFHSRFSATGKTYRYLVFNRKAPSPIQAGRSWHINSHLNIESMREASLHLIGKQDFSSFMATGSPVESAVRDMRRISLVFNNQTLSFELEADGFLRHMVRSIVGTLVDVGRGRFPAGDLRTMLDARDRQAAGRTAPACGLYLVRVDYPAPFPP